MNDHLDEITAKGYIDEVDGEWLVSEVVRLRAALADAADALCECGMSEHYAPLMARIDALLAAPAVPLDREENP